MSVQIFDALADLVAVVGVVGAITWATTTYVLGPPPD